MLKKISDVFGLCFSAVRHVLIMCDIPAVVALLNGKANLPHLKFANTFVSSSPVSDITKYLTNYKGRNYDVMFATSNLLTPNNFSTSDLTAIRNLSVSTSSAFNAWLLSLAGQAATTGLLIQIPNTDLALVTKTQFPGMLGGDGASPVSRLWNLLVNQLRANGQSSRQGIQVVASKLIAGKRPRLVPITDSFVREELGIKGWGPVWSCYHTIVSNPAIAPLIAQVRAGVAANGPFDAGVTVSGLSDVRILDLVDWCFHERRLK